MKIFLYIKFNLKCHSDCWKIMQFIFDLLPNLLNFRLYFLPTVWLAMNQSSNHIESPKNANSPD